MTQTHRISSDARATMIHERRAALGVSREQLGAAAGGVASRTIFRLEHGHVFKPRAVTLAALESALDEIEAERERLEIEANRDHESRRS